jgi:Sulfotransferase domain
VQFHRKNFSECGATEKQLLSMDSVAEDLQPKTGERPRCWGIGLGRTGTTSLCEALRILGYIAVGHNPPFEALRSLDGGADNGVTLHYKYLDYKFPGSKFVLTTRVLEDWLSSMAYIAAERPILSREEDTIIYRRMTLYETVTFDREKFIQAYLRHHADVRRYFANRSDDLLEMSIVSGEGWKKLCPFLGVPIPRAPFPHLHFRQ